MQVAEYIQEHFPEVEPGIVPFGSDVLVQLRTVKSHSSGGIALPASTQEFNNENTMIGRLIRRGQLAFRNRETAQLWPEGVWAKDGEIVLVPRFGGFKFYRIIPGSKEKALFCLFKDYELRGGVKEGFADLDQIV